MTRIVLIIFVLALNCNVFASNQISNLVAPVSYFVNHVKQLNNLKNNLNKYRQASVIGTSGIGKTQLIRTYAYENKNQYHLTWFLDCNLDINQEFIKLAKQLNQETNANLSEDPKLVQKEISNYLSSRDKWLLVFDNLKIGENKKVKEFVEWQHNGHVIFASQDKETLPYTIKLTVFDKKDTTILAANLLENKNDVKFLVEDFGNYPIIITQGAQLLNQIKGLNKEVYMKKIHQSADKIRLNIEEAINELKPTSINLLAKIALLNNQRFSKNLLKIITNHPEMLDDDIYQLSKFALILNIDSDEDNLVFEMHDVIAQKILELSGNNNKLYLEEIVIKLTNFSPATVVKSHLFRKEKTVKENLEVIARNIERYNIDTNKTIRLNLQLTTMYVNSLDLYNAQKLIDWFNQNEEKGKFKLWLMNNDEKAIYSEYLAIIGGYYRRLANYTTAVHYYIKAKEIFANVTGYQAFKSNLLLCLGKSYLALGQLKEAEKNIKTSEQMFNEGLVDKTDIGLLYFAKARLLFMQGKYHESLEQTNNTINVFKENGIKSDDLYFTGPYMLKAEILNILQNYQESRNQLKQVHDIHKTSKKEDHEIFARIYTQIAKNEFGLENIDKALEYIKKAIEIFLTDNQRNPKEAEYLNDPDLAASYVVQGNIYFFQNNFNQAIESYKKAQIIYFYLYRENSKNVAQVSYLYKQGAKVSCKAKDLYSYKAFGMPQVKEFGVDHPNTISMIEYCKQYDMDLWAED